MSASSFQSVSAKVNLRTQIMTGFLVSKETVMLRRWER